MARTAPLSVRFDPDLNARLTEVAAALDRPRSWVIEQAVRDYLDHEAWVAAAVDAGIAAAEAGRTVAHEDVARWLESWGSATELPPPRRR